MAVHCAQKGVAPVWLGTQSKPVMRILFLTGWHAAPGGIKSTFLREHGHEVIEPLLDDEDFSVAIRTAQHAYDVGQPNAVVGLSRGGAVAMNIDIGETPLILMCPGWKRWGTATTVGKKHPHSAFTSRRCGPVSVLRRTREQQRPATGSIDRRWKQPLAVRSRATSGDAGGVRKACRYEKMAKKCATYDAGS